MKRLIFCILLALASALHAATTVNWYIDQDISSSGDGTAWGTAYKTWSDFQTAHGSDNLVSLDNIYHVHFRCSSGSAAGMIAVSSWTVDSTHYLILQVDDPHTGTRDATKFRAVGPGYDPGINLGVPYTWVVGFQIKGTSGSGLAIGDTADYSRIVNCLVYDSGQDGIYTGATNFMGVVFINCVVVSSGRYGIYSRDDVEMYNCSFVNNATSNIFLASYIAIHARNCYAGGVGASLAGATNPNWSDMTTCATPDGAQSTIVAACATDSGAYFTSVTDGSEDIHIGADSLLRNTGTDISASLPTPPAGITLTVDPDGNVRPQGLGWEIGVDEYAEVPAIYATNPSPADDATGQNRTVQLSWTDDASAASHDLWGGTDQGSLTQLQTASTQQWYVVPNLTPGVPYYWRVDEIDGSSNTTTGEVWTFTPAGKVGARNDN